MATLIFGAIGSAIGGPLGGAIGVLLGRGVDGVVLGGGKREGPRLKELAATSSSYGTVIPRHFGRMRVPGTIIWATDLKESRESQGGSKNKPSVTTFTYTASFAVALSSRPILSVGRIWADGNLLRGAEGDLKVDGEMRVYKGHGDQEPDPLIAETEGAARCPAWRGLAYVVFEELALSDFFNRIPSLTFEVIADEGAFLLDAVVGEVLPHTDAAVALDGVAGLSCEGPLAETLAMLDPIFPMDADASGERLTLAPERLQDAPIALPEPAAAVEDRAFGGGDFGARGGFTRKRLPPPDQPPEILRYYDVDRDHLPGLQRATGRARPGQPQALELPAAMSAADARLLVERMARRADWSREQIAWRSAELDPAVTPGAVVTLPGQRGRWRVADWEWRASGVELTLRRVVPTGADAPPAEPVDPGRINPPPDLPPAPSALIAFELPWDGTGSGDAAAPFAAVSSPGANWSGAALFADHGGELTSLGPSGRTRSIVGTAETTLPAASPLLFDRGSDVTVALIDPGMALLDATGRQLSAGANRALLGDEIIQFGRAEPLGGGRWKLSRLLRGRGSTENAVAGHVMGEPFVLLDSVPVALDPVAVGSAADAAIVAAGRGDEEPVSAPIQLRGITLRPLAPVHPRLAHHGDGSLTLSWTRRARGAWLWRDGVDTPLHEQAERYQLTLGPLSAPLVLWDLAEPQLTLNAAALAALPTGELRVRQRGSYALSEPLSLATIP